MTVGVFGCGPIGLLIVQLAKLSGAAQVIATNKLLHRVDAAKRFGANQAYLAEDRRELAEIRATTNERGVDAAFAAVLPGGKVILAGIPDGDQTSFSASIALRQCFLFFRYFNLAIKGRSANGRKHGLIDYLTIRNRDAPC